MGAVLLMGAPHRFVLAAMGGKQDGAVPRGPGNLGHPEGSGGMIAALGVRRNLLARNCGVISPPVRYGL